MVRVPASSAGVVTAPAQAVPFGFTQVGTQGSAAYHLPSGSYTLTAPA